METQLNQFLTIRTTTNTQVGDPATKTPKMSGYQLFVREKMDELKYSLPQIGNMWKALSDEQKGIWKTKAEELNNDA